MDPKIKQALIEAIDSLADEREKIAALGEDDYYDFDTLMAAAGKIRGEIKTNYIHCLSCGRWEVPEFDEKEICLSCAEGGEEEGE